MGNLLELPNEILVHRIIDLIPPRYIVNVALTCRDLYHLCEVYRLPKYRALQHRYTWYEIDDFDDHLKFEDEDENKDGVIFFPRHLDVQIPPYTRICRQNGCYESTLISITKRLNRISGLSNETQKKILAQLFLVRNCCRAGAVLSFQFPELRSIRVLRSPADSTVFCACVKLLVPTLTAHPQSILPFHRLREIHLFTINLQYLVALSTLPCLRTLTAQTVSCDLNIERGRVYGYDIDYIPCTDFQDSGLEVLELRRSMMGPSQVCKAIKHLHRLERFMYHANFMEWLPRLTDQDLCPLIVQVCENGQRTHSKISKSGGRSPKQYLSASLKM